MHDTPLSVIIRQATVADASSIAEIHIRSWQWAYRGLIPDDYLDHLSAMLNTRAEEHRVQLARNVPQRRWWVIEEASRIVGFAITGPSNDPDVPPTTAMIYALYLAPDRAGKGVGRSLFAHAVAGLQRRAYTQATLWVLENNLRARRFYEAAGWTPDGARKTEEMPGAQLHEVRYHIILQRDS